MKSPPPKRTGLQRIATALALLSAAAAGGCGTLAKTFGSDTSSPDEFRVVTKAPLIIPPEYNLRPPRPGDPRPQELTAAQRAQRAILGSTEASGLSQGEQLLVAKAGTVLPNIRELVDYDSGGIVRKSQALSNNILGIPATPAPGATPEAEAERAAREQRAIQNATGGQPIVIKRGGGKTKLPGL